MKSIELKYDDGGVECRGYLALPEADGPRPAVMVSPAWEGRDEFACDKARAWAALGYVGCAVDVYGGARLGSSPEENGALMQPFLDDRAMLRRRLLAAFDAVAAHPSVDGSRIVATGYCFGGLCVLDLARSGAAVAGVVSNHGLLMPPDGLPSGTIRARVLVLHGHDDPMVPPDQVLAFETEMTAANVDWQVHVYGQAAHSFTNPGADGSMPGLAYHPLADRRAWRSAVDFVAECVGTDTGG